MTKFLPVVISILAFCSHLQAEVIVYPIPEGAPINDTYVVRVRPLNGEWQKIGVYNAEVRTSWDTKTNASMTYFDFDAPVEIEVQISSVYVNKVNIRPVRYHLSYSKLDQHTFRFIMERPRKISVEVNDMIYNNLHLFTRYPEEDPVTSSDENMIFFGPGFHQVKEQIILDNDQTLYVAGGAYVEIDVSHKPAISSHIYASGKSNIAVRGRGI
ncbi:MAG: hypothetical protein K9G38_05715, partial [Bacteroidales bacterium]|nr:hypothetical protein [Bacteroidales bacterium]